MSPRAKCPRSFRPLPRGGSFDAMTPASRIARLAGVLAAASLAACRSATDSSPTPRLGAATVTIESASGTRTIEGMEAAFYVYNPGPTNAERAMYLSLGTRERKEGAFSLQLFQYLANNQESPSSGAFPAQRGAMSSSPAMDADVRFVEGGVLKQFFPAPDSTNTVTIEVVSRFIDGERAGGSFDIYLVDAITQSPIASRRIHGTFSAERVTDLLRLPTVR